MAIRVVAILLALAACTPDGSSVPGDRRPADGSGQTVFLDRDQRQQVVSGVRSLLPADQKQAPVGDLRAIPRDGKIAVCGTAFTRDQAMPFFGELTRTFYVWTLARDDRQRDQVRSLCREAGLS